MAFKYNPLSGNIEDQQQGPQGAEGTVVDGVSGGTAGTPAFRFNGDSDTGMYSAGADTIGLSTGGTGKLFITSAGTFGFNTSTVREIGHIHKTSSDEAYLRFTNTTTGTGAGDGFNIGISPVEEALVWNKENTDMCFGTNGTARVKIKNNGKVTIGESGAHDYNAHVAVDDLVVGGGSSHGITIVTGNTSTGSLWFDGQDSTRGYIQYAHNEQSLILGTEGNERLRITSDGSVVIRHNGATASDGYAGLEVRADKDKHQLVLASNSAVANDNRATLGFKVHNSGQNERIKGAIIVEGTGGGYGQADYMSFCLDSAGDNGNADTTADEKLRITATGNVGIGTTTPTARLEVSDSAATVLKLNSTSSNGTALRIYNNSAEKMLIGSAGEFIVNQGNNVTDSAIRANGAFLISAGGSGYESMRVDSSGNVGIGQTAPSSDYRVTIRSGTSPHSPLFLDTSQSNYNTNLYFAKQGTAKWTIGNTATGDHFRFVSGSDERLRITSDGNLGIGTGTNSPDARVTVDGTTNPTVSIKTSGTKRVTLAADTGNSEGVLATYEGYPLKFSSSAGGGTNMVMTLLNNGNVGIGTDTPNQLLDIRANATDTRIQIGPASTADALSQLPNNSEYGLAIAHGNAELGLHKDAGGNYEYVMGTWSGSNIPLVFRTGMRHERVRITNNGNVGIGGNNPQTPVHIALTGTSDPAFSGGIADSSVIRLEDTSDNDNRYHGIDLRSKRNGDIRLYAHDKGSNQSDFVILTDNGGISEKLRVTYEGNVGIGTATPSTGHKLTVHGGGLAVTGQNTSHKENALVIGQEPSGKAQLRAYGNSSSNGSIEFNVCKSTGINPKLVTINADGDLVLANGDLHIAADKDLWFGDQFTIWRASSGNNYINSNSGSLYIRAQQNNALEIKSNTDSLFSGNVEVNPNANNTGQSPILKLTNGTNVSGGKNYSLRVNRPGVSNTGFTIYNESDSRNELSIDGSGNASFAGNITVENDSPSIALVDANNNSDYKIKNVDGALAIQDTSNSDANRLIVQSDGSINITGDTTFVGKVNVSGGTTKADLHIKSTTNSWPGGILLEDNIGGDGWNIHPEGEGVDASELKIAFNNDTTGATNVITHVLSLTPTGNVELKAGNLVLADDKGIDFSAYDGNDTSGTATTPDGNILKDYEEGTFSLGASFATSGSATLSGQTGGHYVKIGKLVWITLKFLTTGVSSPSGQFGITGLPFVSDDDANNKAGISIGLMRDWATDMPNAQIHISGSTAWLYKQATNTQATQQVVGSDLATGNPDNYLYASGCYMTT